MKAKGLLLATAATVSLGGVAQAASFQGWYVGLEGGANWVQGLHVLETRNAGATKFQEHMSFDTGWALLGTVGFEWDQWRFEGEVGYRYNNVDTFVFSGGPVTSDTGSINLSELTLMANVLYDIPLGRRFSLSVGAGIGVDRASFDWPGFGGGGFRDESWRFAEQGIVGLNYAFDGGCEAFIDYRYLHVDGPTFSHGVYELDFDSLDKQSATIGLRYHF